MQRFILSLFFLAGALVVIASSNNDKHSVFQLTIDNAIGPATDDYVERAIENATLHQATLIVIQMDTPDGLDSAMRSIIKNITNSSVPVAVKLKEAAHQHMSCYCGEADLSHEV